MYFLLSTHSKLVTFLFMQVFYIVCEGKAGHGVMEVENWQFVIISKRSTPPSNKQLWWRKVEQDGSFVIISIEYGKALGCMKVDNDVGSQVILVNINEGEHWVMMEDGTIASLEDEIMYFDHHQFLYVGRKEKNMAIHCTLQTTVRVVHVFNR